MHFFDAAGEATWVIIDPSTGAQEGLVHGRPVATAQTPSQPDDGGFGSVASLLLQAHGGEGALASCTYIQRLNVLGGDAPKAFFMLPAWNSIPNAEAAFPYQADYIFLSGGTPGTAQAIASPDQKLLEG
ncbi:g10805 [Coccomyxa viridis]|uniref:G10805 protein n=1 Tax=Coccomyxa viridis TaxID=1274662 RepID=A0ABP1GC82_9CHLO